MKERANGRVNITIKLYDGDGNDYPRTWYFRELRVNEACKMVEAGAAFAIKNLEADRRYTITAYAREGCRALLASVSFKLQEEISTAEPAPNQAPAFPTATASRTVAENTASGQNIGSPVAATDPDTGDTLTYSLEGADAPSFAIDADTGQLQTDAALTSRPMPSTT